MENGYDAAKLAADVKAKRKSGITTRQAAQQIGTTNGTVWRAENCKGLALETFIKICAWLEVSPGAYFKTEAE